MREDIANAAGERGKKKEKKRRKGPSRETL